MDEYIKYFELLAALAAIINWRAVRQNKFLQYLAFLIIFIAIVEWAGYYIALAHKTNMLFYNFIVEPGIFALYAFAFYHDFGSKKNKRFAWYGGIFAVIFYFATFPLIDITMYMNVIGYDIGALFIAALAVLKILEIVTADGKTDYFREPFLYLLLAIVFFYLVTIPHYSASYYYYRIHQTNPAERFLNFMHSILNFILYSCYAITFLLCSRQRSSH